MKKRIEDIVKEEMRESLRIGGDGEQGEKEGEKGNTERDV